MDSPGIAFIAGPVQAGVPGSLERDHVRPRAASISAFRKRLKAAPTKNHS